MKSLIFTNDIYLHKALTLFLKQTSDNRLLCVIDIDSFPNLNSFKQLINSEVSLQHRLIFIGGKSICSKVLEPLVTIYRNSSVLEFRQQIRHGRTTSRDQTLLHISKCLDLKMLSKREKETFHALGVTHDVKVAAERTCMSPKTMYNFSRTIAQKLNLRTIHQVRQFIHSEMT